ncbi:beta strand repeat-containing protein [Magnetospirillum fulvum]|uniref:Hemolysin-type calcium-binding region n=1 Tax=Magnetospirillum fulvum MGU-K5 TaxID=1316936 RepID=S9S880_MAGFU|nr:hypothetical protein [Magnetospirillum fulvum]EPY00293.1 Hemolysin-type calcium-binding region [Magnetospirillum fulvum MGU-K5]
MTSVVIRDSVDFGAIGDHIKDTLVQLFDPQDFSDFSNLLNDGGRTGVMSSTSITVISNADPLTKVVFGGSGMGLDLSSGRPKGSVSTITLYQAKDGSTTESVKTADVTLSSSQYVFSMYSAADSSLLSKVTLTGTGLPTSTNALSSLLGFDITSANGSAVTSSGTLSITGLSATDALGDTISFSSTTGFTIAVPSSVTGANAYVINLTGSFPLNLTAAQIKGLMNGTTDPLTLFTQTPTGLTITDSTTNTIVASVTGIPSGTTLGTLLKAVDNKSFGTLFSASDVIDASGSVNDISVNLATGFHGATASVGTLIGGSGNDTLVGTSISNETLIGGAGNDSIIAQNTNNTKLTTSKLWSDGGINGIDSAKTENSGRYLFFVSQDSRLISAATNGTVLSTITNDSGNGNIWNVYRYDTVSGKVVNISGTGTTNYVQSWDVSSDGATVGYIMDGKLYVATQSGSGYTSMLITQNQDTFSSYSGVAVSNASSGCDLYYVNQNQLYRYNTVSKASIALGDAINNGSINAIASSADDTKVAILTTVYDNGSNVTNLVVLNASTGAVLKTVSGVNTNILQGVSNDGQFVLTRDYGNSNDPIQGAIHLYNTTTGTDLLATESWSRRVTWSGAQMASDGTHVYLVFQSDGVGLVTDETRQLQTFRADYNISDASWTVSRISSSENGMSIGYQWVSAISDNGKYALMMGNNTYTDTSAVSIYDSTVAAPGTKATDTLIGGDGADILTGGAGTNVFVYAGINQGGDTITNFKSTDKIFLQSSVWGFTATPTVYDSKALGTTGVGNNKPFLYTDSNALHYVSASGTDTLLVTTTGTTVTSANITFSASATSYSTAVVNLDEAANNIATLSSATGVSTTFTGTGLPLNLRTLTGSTGSDTLSVSGTSLDLSGVAVTGIEILKTENTTGTTLKANQADLVTGGLISGNTGTDTLIAADTALNLTSTTLSSIEVLAAGNTGATTFTIDAADLNSLASVSGNNGVDTLIVTSSSIDLSGKTLSSVEVVKAGTTSATTFTLSDVTGVTSLVGTAGIDTVVAAGTSLDLTATTMSSIEVLKVGSSDDTTFTVDQADLAANGSVVGNAGTDTLVIKGTNINLTATTLSGIEVLKAGSSTATTFTVNQGDLAANGSVVGNADTDTLIINGNSLDLSTTTLSSIEILKAGSSAATIFTLDQTDLAASGSVIGSGGVDTLVAAGSTLDLSATTLSSVEIVKVGRVRQR